MKIIIMVRSDYGSFSFVGILPAKREQWEKKKLR